MIFLPSLASFNLRMKTLMTTIMVLFLYPKWHQATKTGDPVWLNWHLRREKKISNLLSFQFRLLMFHKTQKLLLRNHKNLILLSIQHLISNHQSRDLTNKNLTIRMNLKQLLKLSMSSQTLILILLIKEWNPLKHHLRWTRSTMKMKMMKVKKVQRKEKKVLKKMLLRLKLASINQKTRLLQTKHLSPSCQKA